MTSTNVSTSSARAHLACDRWSLEVVEHVARTRRAQVWKARGANGPSALKVYEGPNFGSECLAIRFLQCLDRERAVRVHGVASDLRAVHLEWLDGPTLARSMQDIGGDRTIAILVDAAHHVRSVDFGKTDDFKRISVRLRKVLKMDIGAEYPQRLRRNLEHVREITATLLAFPVDERAIHGDLFPSNIMMPPSGPRIIDPKAQFGEGAFEIAHIFMIDPDRDGIDRREKVIERVSERYAEAFETTRERLIAWGAVRCALSIAASARGSVREDARTNLLDLLLARASI